MRKENITRTLLPLLAALLVVAGLVVNARLTDAERPSIKSGVLDLAEWNKKNEFEMTGKWEFYWDSLFTNKEIKNNSPVFTLVNGPGKWNDYEINGRALPGKGKATYRIHVTGAQPGTEYGLRIQGMATVYRLYIDDTLIAQNGSFGDTESAPALDYQPELASFRVQSSSFDLLLQIENNAYSFGGMPKPVIFGIYDQVSSFDKLLSAAQISAITSLIAACLFFLIFFAVQRSEKDMLIITGISILAVLRFLTIGDTAITAILPGISLGQTVRLDFLSAFWTQLLLLYFVCYVYTNLVGRWQVIALLAYTAGLSVFILLFPFHTVISAIMFLNYTLLFVVAVITFHLLRASWQGRNGAPLLLSAMWLIWLLIFYALFLPDRSTEYYLLTNLHFDYILFILAQVTVVAMRYRRAQKLEIAHLKGQIRPHFIHNALTSIISISRSDPDRARELLADFSSYLRGFYDFDRDELISFSQELELVNAYVSLEQARFGEKLRVEYDIETEKFMLPSLILQPLVENAFLHGLREKENGGTVLIYTKRTKNNKIRVGVRDNGIGFCRKPDSIRQGIGIENINSRLSRRYNTSLLYQVPDGGGCEVYMEIPYKEAINNESMAN